MAIIVLLFLYIIQKKMLIFESLFLDSNLTALIDILWIESFHLLVR